MSSELTSTSTSRADRGAVMLEMALVSIVFFLLIFSLLDIWRYVAVKASMSRGAQAGLTLAQQIDGFDKDVMVQLTGSPDMVTLANARREIIAEATNTPLSFLLDPSSAVGSSARLTNFENRVPHNFNTGVWSYYQDPQPEMAAILRPGEYACDVGASGGNCIGSPVYLCHPSLGDPDGICPPTASAPSMLDTDAWNYVLSEHPLLVKLRAEIKPLLAWPWLGATWVIEAIEVGYREPVRNYKVLPDMNIPVPPIAPPPPIPPVQPPPAATCCCLARDYFTGNCSNPNMQIGACADPC